MVGLPMIHPLWVIEPDPAAVFRDGFEPPQGSVVIRKAQEFVAKHKEDGTPVVRSRREPVVLYCDIIKEQPFWRDHPDLLAPL